MSVAAESLWAHGTGRLFSPFDLHGIPLSNRFVMPPMQRGWNDGWAPETRLAEYYRQRVEAGVSLVISESVGIDHPSSTGPETLSFDDTTLSRWQSCVEAVTDAGGSMIMQLQHEGASRIRAGSRYPDAEVLSPSGLLIADTPVGRAATMGELDAIISAYVVAARRARDIGARGVEVHAAHGFLLDEFLWDVTNVRTDRWGGDTLLERARFPLAVVRAIRQAVPPEFTVGLRYSQWKSYDYSARVARTPEEFGGLLRAFVDAGIDYLHLSTRKFWTTEWDSDLTIAQWAKRFVDVPVIAVGSVGLNVDMWADVLQGDDPTSTIEVSFDDLAIRSERGDFDLVAIGRGLIADPEWIQKVQRRRFDDVVTWRRDMVGM